jgi:hypothetical protein
MAYSILPAAEINHLLAIQIKELSAFCSDLCVSGLDREPMKRLPALFISDDPGMAAHDRCPACRRASPQLESSPHAGRIFLTCIQTLSTKKLSGTKARILVV